MVDVKKEPTVESCAVDSLEIIPGHPERTRPANTQKHDNRVRHFQSITSRAAYAVVIVVVSDAGEGEDDDGGDDDDDDIDDHDDVGDDVAS